LTSLPQPPEWFAKDIYHENDPEPCGAAALFPDGLAVRAIAALFFQETRDHRFSPHVQHGHHPGLYGLSDHQADRAHHDQEGSLFLALSILLHVLGGIPVDRSAHEGVVQQMADAFHSRDEFLLAIVPEGTRKKIRTIRTGFWHIAKAAGVPIICWYLDNETKTTRWLGEIVPGEDKMADLVRIRDLYEKAGYRFPLESAD